MMITMAALGKHDSAQEFHRPVKIFRCSEFFFRALKKKNYGTVFDTIRENPNGKRDEQLACPNHLTARVVHYGLSTFCSNVGQSFIDMNAIKEYNNKLPDKLWQMVFDQSCNRSSQQLKELSFILYIFRTLILSMVSGKLFNNTAWLVLLECLLNGSKIALLA